jgi:precorrin-2 dehydrogenase/sirohydrochlorin ferrochelatase
MKYFPVHLDIRNKTVVIVGGGKVAERKCRSLLDAGAHVRVIAPVIVKELEWERDKGRIEHIAREYRSGDLDGALLAFAATDRHETNQSVVAEAAKKAIPANCADAPESGTFISPAVVSRGDLLITVSTGGNCPALAGKIRAELADRFGDEYAQAVRLLGAIREKLLTEKMNRQYNIRLLQLLVSYDLPKLIKNNCYDELDHLLLKLFGRDFSLHELGVDKRDPE